MATVKVNGAEMNYLEKGSGTPVVLVHGFPLDGRMWREQVGALSSRWRVIVPDLRGFGKSAEAGAFTMDSLADDVHALAEQLKLGRFVLAGLSMGGYAALAYVAKHPGTLRGLILVDTKAEADTAEGKAGRDKMIAQAREQGTKPIADAMFGKLIPEEAAKGRPALARELREIMDSQRATTLAHALAAMRDRVDRTDVLARIDVPTLMIVGEKDGISPPDVMRKMHEKVRGSELLVIPGAGHMTPMEQPGQVNRAMERFLERV